MKSARLCAFAVGLAALNLAPVDAALGGQGHDDAQATGGYAVLGTGAVSAFTLRTTSPTLSPARIRTRPGYELAAGLGYRAGDLRIEGKAMYGRYDADNIRFAEGGGGLSGYFDLRGATLELFYDLPTASRLRPYLGAGVGVVTFRARDVILEGFPPTVGDTTLVSYQLMAGASYRFQSWWLTIGYRYLRIGAQDYETGGVPLRGDPIETHAVQVGVAVPF